ncbi:hypothetical protein AX16_007217 [Volvariella volvacea WC 439]|nr:hypothetical protein AX16_007217 [Volvariella volvacea WC 439]
MGVPSLIMILHFIPQGHRYNVFEDVGCFPFVWNATTAYAVTWAPHLVISLISLVYCVLTIRAFWQTRSQLNELLSSGGYRNLNTARYFRLMALAGTDAICTTPMVILVIVQNINLGVIEWIGWSDAHILWDRVDQFPSMLWANSPMGPVLELNRWAFPACAFVFFAFFGFADEAMKNYRSAAKSISRTIGLSTASEETFNGAGSKSKGINASNGTLPSFVRKSKRNSLDSISDGTSSHIGSEKQEKHPDIFNPDFSYGALTLNDAGGILAAPSASASTSSVSTPVDTKPPAFPPPALTRSSSEIEETSRTPSPTQAHDEKRAHTPDMV